MFEFATLKEHQLNAQCSFMRIWCSLECQIDRQISMLLGNVKTEFCMIKLVVFRGCLKCLLISSKFANKGAENALPRVKAYYPAAKYILRCSTSTLGDI